jgi:hypothetical protein
MVLYVCSCQREFDTQRGYTMHVIQNQQCYRALQKQIDKIIFSNDNSTNMMKNYNNSSVTVDHIAGDVSIINQLIKHEESGYDSLLVNEAQYSCGVELLDLLRRGKCPIFLFDEIIKWTRRAIVHYNIKFDQSIDFTRDKMINAITTKYDMKGLFPITESLYLPGGHVNTVLVFHDFQQCIYSLLTDKDLMKDENLISGSIDELQFKPTKNQVILNDIASGTAFFNAHAKYVNDPHDLLCPIIFL